MIYRTLLRLCLLAVLLVSGLEGTVVLGQTTAPGLDIVIAIDSTASMQNALSATTFTDANIGEIGMRLWRDRQILFPNRGTDVNNLSYDTANFINSWLADFVKNQQQRYGLIDIHTTVLHFNAQPEILVADQSLAGDEFAFVTLPNLNGQRSADFLNLYESINDILDTTDNSRKRAVFIITDSLPCDPSANADNDDIDGTYVRERFCADTARMANHVRLATQSLPSGVEQYIYFVGPSNLWSRAGVTTVRDNWESAAERSQGAFHQLETIDELPSQMFTDVLGLLTRTIIGGRVDDSASIGIFQGQGKITVPPYQEFMDVILFLDAGGHLPRFDSGTVSDISGDSLAQSETGQLQRLRFNLPASGDWRISGYSGTVWVSYKPAQASIHLERANAPGTPASDLYQYEEVRVAYSLQANGVSLVESDNVPDFTLQVRTEEGKTIPLNMTPGSQSFNSETFVLVDSGNYAFDFQVSPTWDNTALETTAETEGTENGQRLFNFLTPETSLPSVQVSSMELLPILGTTEQQSELLVTNTIQIRRSQMIPFRLDATVNGSVVDIPPGLDANLNLVGDGCLDSPDLVAQGTSFIIPGGDLRFEKGQCDVALHVTYTSSLKPVSGMPVIIIENRELGTVNATTTARLDVLLLDSAGQAIDQASFNPADVRDQKTANVIHYTMDDVVSQVQIDTSGSPDTWFTWPPDQLSIDIIFRDSETGEPVDPVFANYTGGDSPADEAGMVKRDFPVPFEFSIVRLGGTENENQNNDAIHLVKNQRVGYYTLKISGLSAGDYELHFEILRDNPQYALDSAYEYSEDVLNTQSVGDPRLYAFLRVGANPTPERQRLGTIGGIVAVILIIAILILRRINRTRGALSGSLAIYKRPDSGLSEPVEVWRSNLPPVKKKTNKYRFGGADLINENTLALNPEQLLVYTKGDRDTAKAGRVWVDINAGNNSHQHVLEPGKLTQVSPDSHYYLVKLTDTVTRPIFSEQRR